MKAEAKPLPVLLTKRDAMLYAASMLDEMATSVTFIALMKVSFYRKPSPEVPEELRPYMDAIVDGDLQSAAMRDAAAEIRAHVQEATLVEARAAARGIQTTTKAGA